MYIIKNALKCIGRSKSRNILIGIIALVIAVSACIGLSIRQAAESAKEAALDGMSVTATISYDRAGAMGNMGGGRPGMGGEGKCVILVSHSPDVADMCDQTYELTKISGKKKRM